MIKRYDSYGANAMSTAPTMPHRSLSLSAAIAGWWHNWIGNRASLAELDKLGPDAMKQIARDVGVDASDVRALAGKWPDSADLLARRMAALHLDPQQLSRTQPAVSNDLKTHCSLCNTKRRCESDLDDGGVDPIWRHYCPNSATLMALTAEPKGPKNDRQP